MYVRKRVNDTGFEIITKTPGSFHLQKEERKEQKKIIRKPKTVSLKELETERKAENINERKHSQTCSVLTLSVFFFYAPFYWSESEEFIFFFWSHA